MYQPDWDPSCPEGGQFYACGNGTKFVGCCKYLDPCAGEAVGCSAGNLRPTSFDPSKYGTFQDQECNAGRPYTCADTSPPFFGCCKSNPCQNNGCPSDDLAGAYLSNNPQIAAEMDPYPPVGDSSSSTSALPTTSSASTGTSAAASATTTFESQSKSVPVAAIAGGSVGGFALLCALIVVVWLARRHVRKSSAKHNRESRTNTITTNGTSGAYGNDTHEKTAITGVTTMADRYRDSPSTVHSYSGQNSPNARFLSDGWNVLSSQQQGYAPMYPVTRTEATSQYGPYSPNQHPEGTSSQHFPSQAYFPSSPSQTRDAPGLPSRNGEVSRASPRKPLMAQYSDQGFARVHQGPPQEMGIDEPYNKPYQNLGLGVYHTEGGNSYVPRPSQSRAELDSGRDDLA